MIVLVKMKRSILEQSSQEANISFYKEDNLQSSTDISPDI